MECPRIAVCGGKQTKDEYVGTCLTEKHKDCILYVTNVSNPEKNPSIWRKELCK